MPAKGLGRVDPPDLRHLALWPATPIIETLPPVPPQAMRRWDTPERYDQGATPRCVDFGTCTMMSALALVEGRRERYKTGYLYRWAVAHDGIPEPQEGTTSRAGLEYVRQLGTIPALRALSPGRNRIRTYRWCRDIRELAAALYHIGPVPIGINWYEGMSDPQGMEMRRAGRLEGGHYIVLDQLDMARGIAWATQTWGLDWPEAYTSPDTAGRAFFTLETLERVVFNEGGEAGIVTDRLEGNLTGPGGR